MGGECFLLGFPKALKTCTDFNGLTFFLMFVYKFMLWKGRTGCLRIKNEKGAAHVRGTNRG